MKKIIFAVSICSFLGLFLYLNQPKIDPDWVQAKLNESLKENEAQAKTQYGDAFKSLNLLAKVNTMNCNNQNNVHNCLVEYSIQDVSHKTNVLVEKTDTGYALNKPIAIK